MANIASTSHRHEIFFGEEEISDVSLATFYVCDKENVQAPARTLRGGPCTGCGGAPALARTLRGGPCV
jgi:hypothetical protein